MSTEYREFTKKEKTWIAKLQKVMKEAPDTLFMFVGSGIVVYAKNHNNEIYMKGNGSVDGSAHGVSISTKMGYDGGDY